MELLLHSVIIAHTAEILSIVAGTLLLVLAVVSLVFYRNWKYEQELDSLLWKVDYKDIEINDTENSSTSSKISRVSNKLGEHNVGTRYEIRPVSPNRETISRNARDFLLSPREKP